MFFRSRHCAWHLALTLAVSGLAGRSAVHAAPPGAKTEKPERSILVTEKAKITGILRDKSLSDAASAKAFDEYFAEFFRQCAPSSPGPNTLPTLRNYLRNFLRTGKSGAAYDRLVKLTFDRMKTIAATPSSPKLHKAARVNAIIVLGELNESEEKDPKPLASVLPLLSAVVQSDRFPDEMKVAAMLGLERFAAAGAIPADRKQALTAAMLKTLNEPNPPAGRTTDGHNWMRRSAAQVLAAMGSPGADGSVVAAFEKIVADSNARTEFRCEIAECLGQLKFPQGSKTDLKSLARLLGHQTVELCERELAAAKASGGGTVETVDPDRARQMLAYVLYSSIHGLEGTDARSGLYAAAAGNAEDQKFIGEVRTKVKAVYASVEGAEDFNLDDVQLKLNDLNEKLGPKPAPKADAVAAEGKAPPADTAKQPSAARSVVDSKSTGGN
jgi:hypothetical protein